MLDFTSYNHAVNQGICFYASPNVATFPNVKYCFGYWAASLVGLTLTNEK